MCRSTGFHGLQYGDRNRITIKSFFVKLSGLQHNYNNSSSSSSIKKKNPPPLPESLTLLYLPRIDGTDITVSGSKIRPDLAAYVTLHRMVMEEEEGRGALVFGSRERVRIGEGVRFEVYKREERLLEGMFRRDEEEEWRLECTCGLVKSGGGGADAAVADVCVGLEGHVALRERVEMVSRRRKRGSGGCGRLELIPEARVEEDGDDGRSDGGNCCSCCDCCESGLDGGDLLEKGLSGAGCGENVEMDLDLDGVRWAVDVGIWVVCFGVGFLVSRASAKNLRRIL